MATRDLAVKIFGDSTDINRAFGQAGDGAEGLGSRMSGLATKATGAAVAIGAGVTIAKGFADAAGDLSEAQNKSNAIFGDANSQITAFSDGAAQALGMSKRETLDYASSFGGLLKSTGQGEDAVAGMAAALTTLTADLGSFNNLANEDVAGKLTAGLRGETEGLAALNIFINAAAVEAKALEMGLGDVNGVLTEQEKIQARYAIILEQSTDAQGDFAATSDGLANSQKILGAEWENMRAKLGEQLAPVFASVFGFLAEKLPEVIDYLGPKLTAASEAFGSWWEEHGPAVVNVMDGVWEVIQKIWEIAEPIFDNMMSAFGEVAEVFSSAVDTISAVIDGDWGAAWAGMGEIVSGIFSAIGALFEGLPGFMRDIGKAMVNEMWDGFQEVWGDFWGFLVGKAEAIVDLLPWVDVDFDGNDGSDGSTSARRYHPGSGTGADGTGGPVVNFYQTITALDAEVAAQATREAVRFGGLQAVNGFTGGVN